MKLLIQFSLSLFIFTSSVFSQNLIRDKKVKDIVLLKSSKIDVERIFKKKIGIVEPIRILGGIITFDFSFGTCIESDVNDWNVPKDIIVAIYFKPNKKPKINSLNLNISKFKIRKDIGDTPGIWTYSNDDLGIRFTTEDNEADKNGLKNGTIVAVEYYPSNKFNNLKCQSN